MDTQKLKAFYQQAENELVEFRPMMADIYSLVIPSKNNWYQAVTVKGVRTDLRIFNDKSQSAAKKWANNLVSLIMPVGTRFYGLKDNSDEGIPDPALAEDLQGISDQILNYLNDSNFYQAAAESFLDLGAGTGGYTINYDDISNELYFTSLDMSTVSFLEDYRGRISYVFRKYLAQDKVSQQLIFPDITFDSDNLDILECVYPVGKDFMYIVTDTEFKRIYKRVQSTANPFVIFRWSKRPSENRGRGVINDILGTINMSNTLCRNVMDALALAISPPLVSENGALVNVNNIKIQPNTVINIKAGSKLTPFPVTPNLPIGYDAIERQNAIIEDAFLANPLGRPDGKELTATEVNARLQQFANDYAPYYNRIQRECLQPTLARSIELLEKHGKIDKLNSGKRKVKISYTSPITEAQEIIDAQKALQAIQFTGNATLDPRYISATFKLNRLGRYAAKAFGMKMDLVNDQDEIDRNLQAIIQKAQQQQQALQSPIPNQALQQPVNAQVFGA